MTGSGLEIERKFLVDRVPADLDEASSTTISQVYLAIDDDHQSEVRVRLRDGQATLTVKRGLGSRRLEEEIAIDLGMFQRLLTFAGTRRVDKVRSVLPAGDGRMIELDRYSGGLDSLVTAEVEFVSGEEADAFEPPPWFGPEVTEDVRYKNQRLARDGMPKPPRADPAPFALHRGEGLGVGITRIVRGQIDLAIDELGAGARENPVAAVHACRKSFKRVRAVLRLVRDELGDETYRRENAAFRDIARSLSSARDSQVLIETFDALCARNGESPQFGAFRQQRARLVADYEATDRRMRMSTESTEASIAELRAARRRLADLRFPHDHIGALGSGFAAIERHWRRAYRGARKQPDDESFHELRKRTKDLWHAAELLGPVAPKAMRALAGRAHELSDLVGGDHDLAVLAEHLGRTDRVAAEHESAQLVALINERRNDLQRAAIKLAGRIVAERPQRLVRRIERASD